MFTKIMAYAALFTIVILTGSANAGTVHYDHKGILTSFLFSQMKKGDHRQAPGLHLVPLVRQAGISEYDAKNQLEARREECTNEFNFDKCTFVIVGTDEGCQEVWAALTLHKFGDMIKVFSTEETFDWSSQDNFGVRFHTIRWNRTLMVGVDWTQGSTKPAANSAQIQNCTTPDYVEEHIALRK